MQFQIPLYQRTYSWTDSQLDQLWRDIIEQADLLAGGEAASTHFMGSVVLAPSPNWDVTFPQLLVVDGQQRLTTLTLALAAIRDHVNETDVRLRDRIDDLFLTNKYKEGLDYFRLLPTQADRDSFQQHVLSSQEHTDPSRIAEAYRFFRQKLVAATEANGDDARDVVLIEKAITSRLTLVSVTADRDDNVHRIFESLNNTGLKLSQADLMRNYLFMRLPKTGAKVYEKHWLPLQRKLSVNELEQLMWLQLVLDGDGKVRQQDMYTAQQSYFSKTDQSESVFERYIKELHRKAVLFQKILTPDTYEVDASVRGYLNRLNQWAAETARPAVLLLLDERDSGRLTNEELKQALSYVESFLIRRALCRIPTNNLNRIFQDLPGQLPAGMPVADAIRQVLSAERRYWPTDQALREAIRAQPFYQFGRGNQRRVVLRRLEESFGHSEPVDFDNAPLTIEHVMPQNPGQDWLDLLADETQPDETPEDLHARVVHTLGNLTLSGDNAKLSNHPFERKQEILASSHLEMNKRIAATEKWGAAEIAARADELADIAISIWPAPLPGVGRIEQGRDWSLVHRAVAALPTGCWTSYGDLASLVGSSGIAVGRHLVDNMDRMSDAHRVLRSDGRVADNFRWPRNADRGDIYDVLREEGISISDGGIADPAQRLTSQDLFDLLNLGEEQTGSGKDDEHRQGRFWEQIELAMDSAGVARLKAVLDAWVLEGGRLTYGKADQVSCFPELQRPDAPITWPIVVYPHPGGARIEVVFQHLARRPPFVDATLRNKFRERLNRLAKVSIPEAKLMLRPNFPFSVIDNDEQVDLLIAALSWFRTASMESED
jgi:alkylated DNA nucleotide flippase Atl1